MWQLPPINTDEILVYLRKSRTDDPLLTVAEVLSNHEQMLNEWVDRNMPGRGRIPEDNRYREIVSGETIESRPRVQELLRRAESPKVKAILTVEPQRLSRGDLEDIGRLVKLLRYSNTLVITLQYTYDLQDERDRDMFERELKRGNEFLEYQKRIMNNGRLLSVSRGNFIAQTAPYGYRKIQIKEGRRKCFTLEPDPDTAPVVRMIFELYRDGNGMTRIIDKLDALCIPAPRGEHWTAHSIPKILKNEHYLGKVVWNKRAVNRYVSNGEIVKSRPVASEYLVYEGKHPALIDRELWDAVHERLGTIPRSKKSTDLINPLAGLLFCKNCGMAMTRRVYKRRDGTERSSPRYICNNQRRCGTASATVTDVIGEVVISLRAAISDFEIKIEKGEDDRTAVHRQMIEQLEKRLKELRDVETAQWDEKIKGRIPDHVFARLNDQTIRDIAQVEQELNELRESVPEPIDWRAKLTMFSAALHALQNSDLPAREKNNLLRACVERIDYDRMRVNNGHKRKRDQDSPITLSLALRI